MHFLCAPTDTPVHGFTLAVITTVMAWLFDDPATRRVVVEPDVRNTAVHALNAAVGFTVVGQVPNPRSKPCLSYVYPRRSSAPGRPVTAVIDHLNPDTLGRRQPAAGPQGPRRVRPRAAARPRVAMRRVATWSAATTARSSTGSPRASCALDHWQIDADSITRRRGAEDLPVDALDFCIETARRARPQRRGAAGLSRGDSAPAWPGWRTSPQAGRLRAEPGRRRLPDHRDGDDRGPPVLRRQQRAARLRPRTTTTGTRRRSAHPVRLVWLAAHRTTRRSRAARTPRTTRHIARRARRRPRPASPPRMAGLGLDLGRLPPVAGAPVAVVQQAVGDVRRRDRRAAARLPRRRAGRLPGAAVDPDVLQRHRRRPGTT